MGTRKPVPVEGVSQRTRDFVYAAKECGFPYLVAAILSTFAWYSGAWAGPILRSVVETFNMSQQSLSKAVENLTEKNDGINAISVKVDALVLSDQIKDGRLTRIEHRLDMLAKED